MLKLHGGDDTGAGKRCVTEAGSDVLSDAAPKFETGGYIFEYGAIDDKTTGSDKPVGTVGTTSSIIAGSNIFDNIFAWFQNIFANAKKILIIVLIVIILLFLFPLIVSIFPSIISFLVAVFKAILKVITGLINLILRLFGGRK